MSDKEILKFAAKAEGRTLKYMVEYVAGQKAEEFIACWNPLTDDGDALRLAVKLWFNIKLFNPCDPIGDDDVMNNGMVEVWREDDDDPLTVEYFTNVNLRYAATRRAVVRAAAEIGKAMP